MLRLAMWSGPRNMSTAMMRAWENRPDTIVVDEPLYGPYLARTGIPHPDAGAVIEAQGTDYNLAMQNCVRATGPQASIFYQKQMTHHLLPDLDHTWLQGLTNAFLIRDPGEVLASYLRTRGEATAEDLGVQRQADIYAYVTSFQDDVVVIDAAEFLKHPEAHLRAWCAALDVDFVPQMLAWPAGRRDSDGVWAPHWYASAWASTGFEPYRDRNITTPPNYRSLVDDCHALYEAMYARRLLT